MQTFAQRRKRTCYTKSPSLVSLSVPVTTPDFYNTEAKHHDLKGTPQKNYKKLGHPTHSSPTRNQTSISTSIAKSASQPSPAPPAPSHLTPPLFFCIGF